MPSLSRDTMICVVKAEDRGDSGLPTEARLYTAVQGQHSGVHTVFPNISHFADPESGTVFTWESILQIDLSPWCLPATVRNAPWVGDPAIGLPLHRIPILSSMQLLHAREAISRNIRNHTRVDASIRNSTFIILICAPQLLYLHVQLWLKYIP